MWSAWGSPARGLEGFRSEDFGNLWVFGVGLERFRPQALEILKKTEAETKTQHIPTQEHEIQNTSLSLPPESSRRVVISSYWRELKRFEAFRVLEISSCGSKDYSTAGCLGFGFRVWGVCVCGL